MACRVHSEVVRKNLRVRLGDIISVHACSRADRIPLSIQSKRLRLEQVHRGSDGGMTALFPICRAASAQRLLVTEAHASRGFQLNCLQVAPREVACLINLVFGLGSGLNHFGLLETDI